MLATRAATSERSTMEAPNGEKDCGARWAAGGVRGGGGGLGWGLGAGGARASRAKSAWAGCSKGPPQEERLLVFKKKAETELP